jgi:hypothetical protein
MLRCFDREKLRDIHLGLSRVFLLWLVVVGFLFTLSEWSLLSSMVLSGMSPVAMLNLWATISMDFISPYSNVLFWYYATSSVLITWYLRVLYVLLSQKRTVSFSSISLSTLGVMGVSVGVFCISCGVIGGYVLLSVITVVTAGVFLGYEQQFLFGIGNLLLVVSIVVARKAQCAMSKK